MLGRLKTNSSRGYSVRLALVIIATQLTLVEVARARDSGIQGVVTDQSEAVVPGVTITVTNVATRVQQKAQTNSVGFYSVPFLNPGTYSVQAAASGFTTVTLENLKLDVQQIARVDFTLNIGTVVETVEVSAAAALLESESTTVGQVIENKRIVEMPLNQRNYLQLATLTTGMLPAATLEVGNRIGRELNDGGVIGMGQHGAQTMVLIDGVDNNSRASGGALGFLAQASRPSVDAVGEFKVVTNNTSAEYGFRMGPKVLVSIKSGSNDFHGSAYEFLRNDALDGSNFFANRSGSEKPPLRQNQFGATIGGPIIRNKTFFFFSYEGTRIRIGRSFLSTAQSRVRPPSTETSRTSVST